MIGTDFTRTLRTIGLAAAIVLIAAPLGLPATAGSSPAGVWKLPEGDVQIAIKPCGEALCGQIVTAAKIELNPDITDERNNEPSLRQRRLKGLTILSGFAGAPPEWKNGSLYNPNDGATYQASLKMVGTNTLKVTACIQWPLCKSVTLLRTSDD